MQNLNEGDLILVRKGRVVPDVHNEFYRPQWQRKRFPVKFRDDLRREIVLRYALGETTAEIYHDVVGRGIHCSYNAIRHYQLAKRWRRLMATIMVSDIADMQFKTLLQKIIDKRQERWSQLEGLFMTALELAVAKNPPEARDFAKIAKILRQLKKLPMGCRRVI